VEANQVDAFWPLGIYVLAVLGLVTVMIALSHILGQRHRDRATAEPFESGIVSAGSARLRISAKFYLLAMFFVIFDLEVAFIVAWAVAARELGWAGYIEAVFFMAVLGVALIYLVRVGALDWGTTAVMKRRREEEIRTQGGEA